MVMLKRLIPTNCLLDRSCTGSRQQVRQGKQQEGEEAFHCNCMMTHFANQALVTFTLSDNDDQLM